MSQWTPQVILNNDSYLTIWEHVESLRHVLFKCVAFFFCMTAIIHYFHANIIDILLLPLGIEASNLQFLSPFDPLYFILKIDLIGGIVLSLPFFVIQFWMFLSPAFGVRKYLLIVVFCLVILLSVGAIFYSYFIVTPIILAFMNSLVISGTEVALTAQGYLNFIITTTLILLAVFQLPIIIFSLSALDILSLKVLLKNRRIIYVIILITTAIITPTTDVITLALVAVPAMAAVELGIMFIRIKSLLTRGNVKK